MNPDLEVGTEYSNMEFLKAMIFAGTLTIKEADPKEGIVKLSNNYYYSPQMIEEEDKLWNAGKQNN